MLACQGRRSKLDIDMYAIVGSASEEDSLEAQRVTPSVDSIVLRRPSIF